MIRTVLAAAFAVSALAIGAPAHAAKPVYTATPCAGDYGDNLARVSCGMLAVDESRGTASARRVIIPVVVIKALEPKPGRPPVFWLQGGPGGASVSRVPDILRSPFAKDLIAVDQDWVYFDQRGSGLGVPNLDCGTVALNDAGPLSPAAAESLKACAARMVAGGIDVSRFNEHEVALDIDDLRVALGYDKIDLVGGSYGTSIAMAVLRYAPQGVRAVVLDSPWPPEANWAQGGPQMVSDAVALVVAKCGADPVCSAKYPNLKADVDALARRFLAGPQKGEARSYTADDLGGYLMDAAYENDWTRRLPFDLEAMAGGDFTVLEDHRAERSPYVEGQHLTHLCKEEMPFEDRAKVADVAGDPVAGLLVASMTRYFEVCAAWPVGAPWPADGVAQSSSTPTLFLAAEIDPGCPPKLARAAVARFSKGQLFIAPNRTHGVMSQSPCARRMIRAFLADPTAKVDGSCLTGEAPALSFDYGA